MFLKKYLSLESSEAERKKERILNQNINDAVSLNTSRTGETDNMSKASEILNRYAIDGEQTNKKETTEVNKLDEEGQVVVDSTNVEDAENALEALKEQVVQALHSGGLDANTASRVDSSYRIITRSIGLESQSILGDTNSFNSTSSSRVLATSAVIDRIDDTLSELKKDPTLGQVSQEGIVGGVLGFLANYIPFATLVGPAVVNPEIEKLTKQVQELDKQLAAAARLGVKEAVKNGSIDQSKVSRIEAEYNGWDISSEVLKSLFTLGIYGVVVNTMNGSKMENLIKERDAKLKKIEELILENAKHQ